jgi:hypothetical protein
MSEWHKREKEGGQSCISSIRYRNLAPLYCDEQMRICIKRKKPLPLTRGGEYDIWIEGPTNGVAVMGTVRTVPLPRFDDSEPRTPKKYPESKIRNKFKIHQVFSDSTTSVSVDALTAAQKSSGARSNDRDSGIVEENTTVAERNAKQDNVEKGGDANPMVRLSFRRPTSAAPNSRSRNVVNQEVGRSEHTGTEKLRSLVRRIEAPPSPIKVVPSFMRVRLRRFNRVHSRRGHRRNRPLRIIKVQTESNLSRQVTTTPSPVASVIPSRPRPFVHRAGRARSARLESKPASVLRKYAGRSCFYDPSAIAQRHSRYVSEGVRKMTKPSIRKVALAEDLKEQAERRAALRYSRYGR